MRVDGRQNRRTLLTSSCQQRPEVQMNQAQKWMHRALAQVSEQRIKTTVRCAAQVAELPQISLPIATAVSDMRFEKPHSLSYQVRIEHSVPSITLV